MGEWKYEEGHEELMRKVRKVYMEANGAFERNLLLRTADMMRVQRGEMEALYEVMAATDHQDNEEEIQHAQLATILLMSQFVYLGIVLSVDYKADPVLERLTSILEEII